MTIRIDKSLASDLVREAMAQADRGSVEPAWVHKIEKLWEHCEAAQVRTHIAFFGTAILAKATHPDVDLAAVKPTKAPNNPGAFSARSLCHSVLVPLSAELSFSIGVNGREPLNNQPYFRMARLGDDTPIHSRGREAFDYLYALVRELQTQNTEQARGALSAYIAVCLRHQRRYTAPDGIVALSPAALSDAIHEFVGIDSEGGKRAQASVAGVMDAFSGPDRVVSGRVNDPSRRSPGDVCVRSLEDPETWEKALEVRDKAVSMPDILIFARKCAQENVREAAVVAVARSQAALDPLKLLEGAEQYGIGLTVFESWQSFVEQALFWSPDPQPVAAKRAATFIHERLFSIGAEPAAIELWAQTVRSAQRR